MSTKTIIWIVVIVIVVILGAWWWSASQQSAVSPSVAPQTAPSAQTGQNSPNTTSGAASVSATDNSDAALTQDLSSVDAQMNGLSSDNASTDKGLSNPNQ